MNYQTVKRASLGLGQTFQNEKVRIHRYRDQIVVTDIRMAGVRGKACMQFAVSLGYSRDNQKFLDNVSTLFMDMTSASDPYSSCKSIVSDLQHDYDDIELKEVKVKAVDIEPYGEIYKWEAASPDKEDKIRARVSPTDFSFVVSHHFTNMGAGKDKEFWQDTSYFPVSKKDAQVFYAFMKKDNGRLSGKFIHPVALKALFQELGIHYNSH